MKKWDLPKGWEWKQLGKVGSLISGVTYDAREAIDIPSVGYFPILRATNIQSSLILNNFVYVPDGRVASNQLLSTGDILIAMSSGSKSIVGKAAQLEEPFNGSFGAFCGAFRPNKSINSKYVGYFFKSNYYKNNVKKLSRGANINNLRKDVIREIDIPVPTLETQQKIVSILDKAEEIKRIRAKVKTYTQNLIQSIFLDMFGDPGTNKRNWDIRPLSDLISAEKGIMCGPFGSALKIEELVEKGVPALVIGNVQSNRFNWNIMKHITEKKAEQLKEFSVVSGDVLVLRTGTVGRACIVPDDLGKAVIGPDLLRIRFDRNKMVPEFFSYALNSMPSFLNHVKSISPGATLAHLNATLLKKMEVIAPPIQNQILFLKKYQQIEILSVHNQQISQSDSLLSSVLLKKAFSGDLVA